MLIAEIIGGFVGLILGNVLMLRVDPLDVEQWIRERGPAVRGQVRGIALLTLIAGLIVAVLYTPLPWQ